MNRNDVCILLKDSYETDSMGQRIAKTTPRMVYCEISSVTGTEWFSGSQNGIRPELRVTLFRYEYQGEETVNIGGCVDGSEVTGGTNYNVYRTYWKRPELSVGGHITGPEFDELELYLEKRAGS